jgi:gas vesicle protein
MEVFNNSNSDLVFNDGTVIRPGCSKKFDTITKEVRDFVNKKLAFIKEETSSVEKYIEPKIEDAKNEVKSAVKSAEKSAESLVTKIKNEIEATISKIDPPSEPENPISTEISPVEKD